MRERLSRCSTTQYYLVDRCLGIYFDGHPSGDEFVIDGSDTFSFVGGLVVSESHIEVTEAVCSFTGSENLKLIDLAARKHILISTEIPYE